MKLTKELLRFFSKFISIRIILQYSICYNAQRWAVMSGIPHENQALLLSIIRKIYLYKRMQAGGYEWLQKKTKDERTRRLLEEIGKIELKDSEHWQQKYREIAGKTIKTSFIDRRVRLMTGILGTRGFFEWAIIAEDESVEELTLLAGTIRDTDISEIWSRTASDERLHIERVKKEVLGMEGWEMGGGGGVRDVVFGANDGLVSILALVAGVYGAITESYPILIAGLAGAIAGAISMGGGAYLSSKSEQEVTEKESARKGTKKKMSGEEEEADLVKFYQSKGFKENEAKAIARRIKINAEDSADYTIGEELSLTAEESWPPFKAAILTGLSFAVVSVVPILPFAFMRVTPAVITAGVASIACLFCVGASKAIFTRKSWLRSGLEMMAIGAGAAAATYVIGLAIPTEF
jgi:VIT1/CCC1 family predicted Fe2+/Mn2+ transporter